MYKRQNLRYRVSGGVLVAPGNHARIESGSLVIDSVSQQDEGSYLVQDQANRWIMWHISVIEIGSSDLNFFSDRIYTMRLYLVQ